MIRMVKKDREVLMLSFFYYNLQVRSGAIVADNTVDFYNFRFRTLHALSDFHGPNSLQTKEAKKLLGESHLV